MSDLKQEVLERHLARRKELARIFQSAYDASMTEHCGTEPTIARIAGFDAVAAARRQERERTDLAILAVDIP